MAIDHQIAVCVVSSEVNSANMLHTIFKFVGEQANIYSLESLEQKLKQAP